MSAYSILSKNKESFKLGECCFNTDIQVEPIEFIKQNNFFGHVELENLCILFDNIPVYYFDYKNRLACKNNAVFKKIYSMVCVSEIHNWCCHQAAPYFSVHNPDWNYIFGFAQQRTTSGKIHTFLHSFNSKGEIFADPTLQAKYKQRARWRRKGILKKTYFKPKDFYRYVGIRFPVSLAKKIVFENDNKNRTGNVWAYLIHEVLCSLDKTLEFIEYLKNQ